MLSPWTRTLKAGAVSVIKTLFVRTVFVVITVVGAYACTSKEEAAQEFYRKGMVLYEEGEFDKSRVEFLNAIQKDPLLSGAYYQIGLISQRDGNVAAVFEMMTKSLKLDPQNLDAKKTVAQLLVYGKKFKDALRLSEEIIERDSKDFDGYRIHAAALIGLKQLTNAEKSIDLADAIKKNEVSLFGLRAIVARERGDLAQALNYLDKAIEIGQDKKQYLILRSKIHRDTQNIESLILDLYTLTQVDPSEAQYPYALAKILVRVERNADAEQVLAKFVVEQPNNIKAKQLLVDTISLQDKKRARELLALYINEFPSAIDLKFYRIRTLLKNNQRELAKQQLKKMAAYPGQKNNHLKARALLAEVLLSEGERKAALKLLFENLKENRQHEETHLVKAKYDLDNKDYELAIGSLRTVLKNNPDSETGLVLLGRIYTESGSDLLADDSFRQVLQVNPANVEAAIPVVRTLIEGQDLERAEKIIMRVLDSSPYDPKLLMFYAQIKLLQQDWVGAKSAVERLEFVGSAEAYVAFLRGRITQGKGLYDEALGYYTDALDQNPKMLPALEGLVACYLAVSKESELLLYLKSYKHRNPDLVFAYSATAQVHLSNQQFGLAITELESALRLQPDWVKGYARVAGLKNDLNDTVGAISIYKQGIRQNPKTPYLKVILAAYYESLNLVESAAKLYEEIVRDHPAHSVAANNYAALLLERMSTPENDKRAMALAEQFKRSKQPIFMDTYGWALVKNSKLAAGESVLRLAAEQAPQLIEIQYHFAVVLKLLGRIEEARGVVKKAQRKSKPSPEMSLLLRAELRILEKMRQVGGENW